jgi:hypothetical protein
VFHVCTVCDQAEREREAALAVERDKQKSHLRAARRKLRKSARLACLSVFCVDVCAGCLLIAVR